MARFDGKVALVTGAASGIGRATAERIASEGGTVVVADVQIELGQEVAARIVETGGDAIFALLDVTSEEGWQSVVSDIIARFGQLDILVNNAGIGDSLPLEDTPLQDYRRVVEVTSTSVFLGMKAASTILRASGNGAVVNISSIFGISGGFGMSPGYASAKGAVRTLTKNIALAWAPHGIRVNSVHPGFIDTPILGDADHATLAATIPMNRVGKVNEVAAVIAFLASDEASYLTGTELVVDGGYLAR